MGEKTPCVIQWAEPLPPIDPFIQKVALLGSKRWVLGACDDIRLWGRLAGPRYTCRTTIAHKNIHPRSLMYQRRNTSAEITTKLEKETDSTKR